MVLVSGLLANCSYSGVSYPYHLKVPFWIQRHKETRFKYYNMGQFASRKIPRESIQYSLVGRIGTRCVTSVGRNHPELRFDDDIHKESYWSSLSKEVLWALRSLFEFLVEQPSQLKYIEWPSFQSTAVHKISSKEDNIHGTVKLSKESYDISCLISCSYYVIQNKHATGLNVVKNLFIGLILQSLAKQDGTLEMQPLRSKKNCRKAFDQMVQRTFMET